MCQHHATYHFFKSLHSLTIFSADNAHQSLINIPEMIKCLVAGNMSVNIIGQATALENRRPALDAVEWPELRNVIQVSRVHTCARLVSLSHAQVLDATCSDYVLCVLH
jgi:hypothetical protein